MTARPHLSRNGRKESLIGICAAIGEDFGFNPDIPRVALAVGLLFAPLAVLALYGGMGLFVLASRLLFPPVRPARVTAEVVTLPAPVEPEPLREAA